ncbi:MAG: O-antigen ligase family protein [Actinobacteria bacterium]|jgi:O-antigen ligase|nr:O-antigen ligase family protein [Actinomycetota bacterium]
MGAGADGGSPTHRPGRGGDLAVVGYALAVVVGVVHVVVPNWDAGLALPATAAYLAGLVVLLLVRRVHRSGRDTFGALLTVAAVAGVVLAGWVMLRFALALPDAVGAEYGFYRLKGRITTPLGDHNTAAGLLLPMLVATTLLAVRDPRWRFGAGLVALGIAATLSRGAAAVLAVVVVLAFAVASRREVAVTLTAALAVVVAVLVLVGSVLDTSVPAGTAPSGPSGESGLAEVLGASILGRIDLAARGVEVGVAHPLAGIGLGAFGDAAADLPEPNDHAHQQFAHAIAEGGMPLLLATLLVVGALVVRAGRALRGSATPQRDLVVLGGAGLLLHAQVDIQSGLLGLEVVLAALTGLAATVAAGTPDSLPAPADLSPPA